MFIKVVGDLIIVIQRKQRKHAFTFDERLVLEDLWLRQYSVSRIARYLERSRYEIERELNKGNIIYFQGLSERELKLMAIHKRIKYSARYAQQFIVQTNIYHEERHHLTPEIKQLVETKLAQGLSPEKIKQLYTYEIPVSARMLRYYIDQGLIQKRLHKDAIHSK